MSRRCSMPGLHIRPIRRLSNENRHFGGSCAGGNRDRSFDCVVPRLGVNSE
jgi:hypothetical protein